MTALRGALLLGLGASLFAATPVLADETSSAQQTVQAIAVAGGGGGSSSGTQTLRYAPAVVGPTIYPGQCQTPVAAGVSLIGFGGTLGAAIPDAQCNRRQNAAALLALDRAEAARELMCGEADVRAAMLRAGTPCALDRPVTLAAAPTLSGETRPIAPPPRVRPAFCSAVGAEEMPACR